MLADNAVFTGPSDIVAENVTALPASPVANRLVYLTQTSGANAPGLYIYGENIEWTLLSNGAVVS